MDERKAITLEQLEIVKGYIDDKDALNIKSAEFVDSIVKLYTSEDKSGEPVVELVLPEEMFLDGSKTEFVDNFVWSAEKYPKSINPDLDGKPVLVLAVKSVRTIRYSFISLESVVVELTGGDTDSTSVTVEEDTISLDVKVSEEPDNRVIVKDDGLYVGAVDTTPQWTVSTDEEVSELFSLDDTPSYGEGTLGAKNVGDIVQVMENGKTVNFIVVQKGCPSDIYDESCNGVWLLREKNYDDSADRDFLYCSDSTSDGYYNDYEKSKLNQFMNTTYYDVLDNKIKEIIKEAKLPHVKGRGGDNEGVYFNENGLSCKVFCLSFQEVFGQGNKYFKDGDVLQFFLDTSAEKRKYTNSKGSSSVWVLRTPQSGNLYFMFVSSGGGIGGGGYGTATSNKNDWTVRPAFILPYDTPLNPDGLILG